LGKLTDADLIMNILQFIIISSALIPFYVQAVPVLAFIPWVICKLNCPRLLFCPHLNFHVALIPTQADYLKLCGTISQTPAELQNVSSETNLEIPNEVGNESEMGGLSVSGFSSSER
jgi:hypothetical protein